MFAFASSWNMYSLPVRFAGSPLHFSFDNTPNFTPHVRRIANIDLSDFWKSASNDPAQPSHTMTSCFVTSNVSSSADWTNFVRWSYPSPQMLLRRSRLLYIAPRYSGASPFEVSPRRDPIRIGRCSMPTGHWFSHAPQVVHCQSTFSEYTSTSLRSRSPSSRAPRVCRMIAF